MNEAVVVTEWYVVPGVPAEAVPRLLARAERAAPAGRLDAATAGTRWAWAGGGSSSLRWHGSRQAEVGGTALVDLPRQASARAERPRANTQPVVLSMPPAVLRAMSLAAQAEGCSESALWAEAAREWLARHLEDDPQPPTPGASAPVGRREGPARLRGWSAIDVLLRDLRAPLPAAREDEGEEPAA